MIHKLLKFAKKVADAAGSAPIITNFIIGTILEHWNGQGCSDCGKLSQVLQPFNCRWKPWLSYRRGQLEGKNYKLILIMQ